MRDHQPYLVHMGSHHDRRTIAGTDTDDVPHGIDANLVDEGFQFGAEQAARRRPRSRKDRGRSRIWPEGRQDHWSFLHSIVLRRSMSAMSPDCEAG